MKGLMKILSAGFLLFLLSCGSSNQAIEVKDLTVEGRSSLPGTDIIKPRLSWKIAGDGRDITQSAYQVIVASTPENLEAGKGALTNCIFSITKPVSQ